MDAFIDGVGSRRSQLRQECELVHDALHVYTSDDVDSQRIAQCIAPSETSRLKHVLQISRFRAVLGVSRSYARS